MPNPRIVIIDDRPHWLAALRDTIARRYGTDYEVTGFASASEALDELARIRERGEEVALIIADQWMPEMTGGELLQRAHDLHPEAQRALLVGWGDQRANETILSGCARGVLDNYVLKPWSPPEVHLYPLITEFLAEWARQHQPRLELVRLVYEEPSARGVELRDLLERNAIPHGWYRAGADAAREVLAKAGADPDRVRLPALVTFDGRVLEEPSNAELADTLGVSENEQSTYDLAIVGGGPCGLAAAVYAASEGLSTVVVECEAPGGQAGTSTLIRNFIGFPRGVAGADLALRAYQQAWLFGAKYVFARKAVGLRAEGDARIITLEDGRELVVRAVLIATGAEYRHLEVPSIERLNGVGVSYVSGHDHALALRGEDVVVVGGGNSAGQAVTNLAKTAHRVVLCVRGEGLSKHMSQYLADEIEQLPNVEVRFNTEVVDAAGERGLERVTLRHRSGTEEVIETPALFVMIGARPRTNWLHGVLERDRTGSILTGSALPPELADPAMPHQTSMPGVFAAGDVRYGSVKRLASAVGDAAIVMPQIHAYLRAHPPAHPEASPQVRERTGAERQPAL